MVNHESPESRSPVVEVDAELADLIPQYLSNRWADLSIAQRLLSAGSFASLANMAHKIRGSAAGYGFVRLGEIARAIETSAEAEDAADLAVHLAAYDAYLRSVRIEYV